MKIAKSTRHAKIAGDFTENLVLYWLSKYGAESARVDHTGIDLIARNPRTKELMGISVKARTRTEGRESTDVRIEHDKLKKAEDACRVFDCIPYLAVVVDGGNLIRCFICSFRTLYTHYPAARHRNIGWRMSEKAVTQYYEDRDIKIIEFVASTKRWW